MVMRRHHACLARFRRVLLLAFMVVLMLAAVSDGIRLEPADVKKPVRGQEIQSATASQGNGATGLPPLLQDEVRATGSSLPDCTHACGACSPCSRVMVSFKCSVAEPLPCPMVYRCMCRGKCYPVPSN
ncbi:hypothetical protein PR202_gb14209 [Eleusine coracana subsp. coracana]|uniref:Epidermal patterning factor-like protein n=1 Tax=Eleusine coracana subsp. coracana TaxID=191504 RepID=A0AAV5EV23_ELECO|nr:hypothetical protein QOZ80_4BG0333180 [Eleusine coracana subsp. coracana]GJN26288.1 hypothetical protein PR202_gb14209 [Eleusine coracana subsp. coracana]